MPRSAAPHRLRPFGAWRSLASAPVLGTGGRRFESSRPDQRSRYSVRSGRWFPQANGLARCGGTRWPGCHECPLSCRCTAQGLTRRFRKCAQTGFWYQRRRRARRSLAGFAPGSITKHSIRVIIAPPLGEPKGFKRVCGLFWLAMISSPTRAAAAIFHNHRPAKRFRKLFGDGAGGQVLRAAGSKGHDAACGTAGSGFRVCSAYGKGRGNTACQYRAPANGCAIDCFM